LGSGKLFGITIIPTEFAASIGYVNNGLMILPPMALILVGLYIWVQRANNTKLIEPNE
jgi:Na+-transporting NADH:ubiquinone oxidoreductase subunit D